MRFDVFGMCNALVDLQAEVDDQTLEELRLAKGSMSLLDRAQYEALLPCVVESIVNIEAGGSGANTMSGVSLLGGRACYTSRVGSDEYGDLYRRSLLTRDVQPNLGTCEGRTGTSLILITPDAQRTMCTYLGVSRALEARDVRLRDLRDSQYLYVTAYLWDTDNQKEAVLLAMREANRTGVQVALSLSDPFCVARHKADLLDLLRSHVDVLVGNADEAQALTDTGTPREAVRALAAMSGVAAVTMDERGSLLCRGEELVEVPTYPIDPVDTTGAGDMYAAGLLYGLTRGLPLAATGRVASYTASLVVGQFGPRLDRVDPHAIAELVG